MQEGDGAGVENRLHRTDVDAGIGTDPMLDPGDGSVISATNISIITYAGNGQWCRQEDIYNPLRFLRAAMKWCRKAQELGTLDEDAARWMRRHGGP